MKKINKKDFGVVYVAFGLPYVYMTYLSIKSLLYFNPEIDILVVTNVANLERIMSFKGRVEIIYVNDETRNNRLYKLSVIDFTIFKKTLYIDCDTIITGSIYEAKDYLNYFDLCIKQKKYPYPKTNKGTEVAPVIDRCVYELPNWNGGIIFFTINNETQQFFQLWKKYYKLKESEYDQTSLISAIYLSRCKILSLEERWNSSNVGLLYRKRNIREFIIIHYASMLTPSIKKELKNIEELFIEKKIILEKCLSTYFYKEKKNRIFEKGKKNYFKQFITIYFLEIILFKNELVKLISK